MFLVFGVLNAHPLALDRVPMPFGFGLLLGSQHPVHHRPPSLCAEQGSQ
jgi:hypothetical protein